MSILTLHELLEAGAHFGHQTNRWNPKMRPFIFGARNGIYIIDLQQTLARARGVYTQVAQMAAAGKVILFVGTKRQGQEVIQQEASRCGMPYVNHRWLGGTLTNFETVKKSIAKLKGIETMKEDGTYDLLQKKEVGRTEKLRAKLDRALGGVKNMSRLPDALFVVDTVRESIAVAEANKLRIPVIAMVDTNSDPTKVQIPIPANDDAVRAIQLVTRLIADAVLAGNPNAAELLGIEPEPVDIAATALAATEPVVESPAAAPGLLPGNEA
ncbi:MAG: 30S ribosomal protein S2 [Nitrospirae bacterium CG18_big_fil_WC_8_21_14_2_50_70_55]|nr:30S ribosomal protein S2 [Deltaproteobacteria bacterium]OIP65103.1 MAG: 30S ribosomal protein S2 [Nitrospirae bacterium CG2_30_70_394]PIQ04228.1 MAG: 30S ribosomal protein S2 [Nitrospirae bacterium CG18_big_fil_WC_8_21_14_2_50_70_55]PIU78761.1 MAG: 30S ribosomal protein S2 [Nitrospirae bacterium CG06_land_8_20_14_3_00_70_43]PIX84425.1 MAG: 30S ribosomal protein S2 [Nitrospirae bacterium CG_4_10_14_3_um_filter_70_108]PJB95376.1 MAG: 30S ribosomal protein S2 [Nitrospirae bacterium CG_4_9_14_0